MAVRIGYILLVLYLVQFLLPVKLPLLEEWQADQLYRRWSGLGLLLFILFQWFLTLYRLRIAPGGDRLLAVHKWTGAFSPLVFYLHAASFGFGYLLLLGLSFFFNFVLGLLNVNVIKSLGQSFFKAWYISHVAFSVLITAITFLHVWVVFYYK